MPAAYRKIDSKPLNLKDFAELPVPAAGFCILPVKVQEKWTKALSHIALALKGAFDSPGPGHDPRGVGGVGASEGAGVGTRGRVRGMAAALSTSAAARDAALGAAKSPRLRNSNSN